MPAIPRREFLKNATTMAAATTVLSATAFELDANPLGLPIGCQTWPVREGIAKDFEFSRRTMEEHWKSGYDTAQRALAEPDVMRLPDRLEGVRIFDVCKDDSG